MVKDSHNDHDYDHGHYGHVLTSVLAVLRETYPLNFGTRASHEHLGTGIRQWLIGKLLVIIA